MSFKAVKELRLSGNLEEALIMANQDLENDPVNIWNKRSIAWVYYEYLKKFSSIDNFDNFIEYLNKLVALELPADEKMIFDNSLYQIGKLLFSLSKDESTDYEKVDIVYEIVKLFPLSKPSEPYTYLYKALHKCYQNSTSYLQFADWWDFSNFMPCDFLPEEFEGRKTMSIAEKAHIAYSKKLLEGETNQGAIREFLPKIDLIIEAHPEYEYPPYYKTRMLLALGNEEEARASFIPFAKNKKNDYWVWELLSDTFDLRDERKIACLCKALSLRAPDKFLINTRQKLAEILIMQGKLQEAMTEVEKIIIVRRNNNWRIPSQIEEWVKEWVEQSLFDNYNSNQDNSAFYAQYIIIAEEVLYSNIPEEIVAIEFVNSNKSMLNFVKNQSKHGFFNYSGMIEKPEIGDIISVRFNGDAHEGFHKVLTLKKLANEDDCEAIKSFTGVLEAKEPVTFGFVDGVFIAPSLIATHQLSKGDIIKGKAILSFNKKKDEWGWKAVEIFKH